MSLLQEKIVHAEAVRTKNRVRQTIQENRELNHAFCGTEEWQK